MKMTNTTNAQYYQCPIEEVSRGVICLLLLITCALLLVAPVQAQQASDSAQTATQSSTLLQKLDSLKKQIASKAAELKSEVTKKMANRMALGKIQTIDLADKSAKINLQSLKNTQQTILADEFTIIQTPSAKVSDRKGNLTLKDLASEQTVIALGDIDDKNNLNAKKIIKLDKYLPDNKVTFWGQVDSISGGVVSLKLKDGSIKKFIATKSTAFKVSEEDVGIEEVVPNRTVIIASQPKTPDLYQARSIFMFGGVNPKEATPSASPNKAKVTSNK